MLANVYVYAVCFALRLLSSFVNILPGMHSNGVLACLSRESSYCLKYYSDVRIFELAPCVGELSVLAESVCEGDSRMRKLPS